MAQAEHSEKGLETITKMGTVPTDWGLTEIKWVKELVKQMVWVECPVCDGLGITFTINGKTMGKKAALKAVGAPEYGYWKSYLNAKTATESACSCPWVRPTRSGRSYFFYTADGRHQ